jgi:putative hemolysin
VSFNDWQPLIASGQMVICGHLPGGAKLSEWTYRRSPDLF